MGAHILVMGPRPECAPSDDGHPAGTDATQTLLARVTTPVRHCSTTLSIIDMAAIGLSMAAMA
jgi:hypothetical protein